MLHFTPPKIHILVITQLFLIFFEEIQTNEGLLLIGTNLVNLYFFFQI
jgi:hypothetical protein